MLECVGFGVWNSGCRGLEFYPPKVVGTLSSSTRESGCKVEPLQQDSHLGLRWTWRWHTFAIKNVWRNNYLNLPASFHRALHANSLLLEAWATPSSSLRHSTDDRALLLWGCAVMWFNLCWTFSLLISPNHDFMHNNARIMNGYSVLIIPMTVGVGIPQF